MSAKLSRDLLQTTPTLSRDLPQATPIYHVTVFSAKAARLVHTAAVTHVDCDQPTGCCTYSLAMAELPKENNGELEESEGVEEEHGDPGPAQPGETGSTGEKSKSAKKRKKKKDKDKKKGKYGL